MTARYQAHRIPVVNVRTSIDVRLRDRAGYGHVRPARPSLRYQVALGVLLGLAAVGVVAATWAAFVIVWAMTR